MWQWMNAGCVTFKNNMVKHFLIIVVTDSSHRENTYLLLDDFLADSYSHSYKHFLV
jgi:hypothetical protein